MFDGVGSPLTQTFGLGLFAPLAADDLDAIEAFFGERGAATAHEVSPLADPAHLALLAGRGYRPAELTTVLHRPVRLAEREAPAAAGVVARRIAPGEEARWAEVAGAAWGSESEALGAFIRDFGLVSAHARGAACFVAEVGGAVVATGCDLATMGAAPGSGSQANAERAGFRVAYTRTKWQRDG